MKILMLGWEYPPHINGGLGTACDGITKALAKYKDISLTFVVPRVYGDENAYHMNLVEPKIVAKERTSVDIQNISKIIFPCFLNPYFQPKTNSKFYKKIKKYIFKSIDKQGIKDIKKYFDFDFATFIRQSPIALEVIRYSSLLVSYFRDKDFDIIHAHDWMTIIGGVVLSRVTGKPLFLHIHSLEYDRSGIFCDPFINEIEKRGVIYAKKIFAVSNYTKGIIKKIHKVDERKIFITYNAVNFKKKIRYKIPKSLKKFKYVLFLGRITSQKGPEYFIRSAKIVLEKRKDVKFIMAGIGDMLQKIMKEVSTFGMSDNFIFTGFLKKNEVTKVLALSDVFVMPSFSEPFGIVALEAVFYGVPTIISKQSGVAEVLPSACVCDYWDTEKIAKYILDILSDENKKLKMQENLLKELDLLSWDKSVQPVYQEYMQEFL